MDLTALRKHSKLDMEMFKVTFNPYTLLGNDGYGNLKVSGSIRVSHIDSYDL